MKGEKSSQLLMDIGSVILVAALVVSFITVIRAALSAT
jgi:hypothetical protein